MSAQSRANCMDELLSILVLAVGLQVSAQTSGQTGKLVKEGETRLRAGELGQARELLERATRLAPGSVAAWKGLGKLEASENHFEAAERAFRRACDLNPGDEDACYFLGRADYALTRLEEALAAYKLALGSGRKSWRAYNGMALALEGLGRNGEAEDLFRKGIKAYDGTANSDFNPRTDFGAFLCRQGRFEEARVALQGAVEDQSGSARAHFELARALVELGRLDAAAAHLNRAVELDPKNGPAHLLLAKVYFRLGRVNDAERHALMGQTLAAQQR